MTLQKKKVSFWVCLVLALLLIISIALLFPFDTRIEQISSVHIGYDYPVATSLSEMTMSAPIIVVGKYIEYDSSWNMARDPDNVLNEDSSNYTEGHLYLFTVEKVLKGTISHSSILVNHRFSETIQIVESNAEVSKEGIITKEATLENELSFAVPDPLYISPEMDVSYILFLECDKDFGNYYGAIEPFSIKISSDDTVILQSNLINKVGNFEETVMVDDSRTVSVSMSGASIDDRISNSSLDDIIEQITYCAQSDN